MIVGKQRSKMTNFRVVIHHNLIEAKNSVKYLRVYLNDKLSWKVHIKKLRKKISKVCGMIYKLRYFVPLSTIKVVFYSMFHLHFRY